MCLVARRPQPYVAGTDGGQSGTGRVDQVIMYHLKFAKIIDFGAQGQLRSGDTPQAFNGFGFSLQAAVLPGLKIGGAYNKTYFNPQLTQAVFNGGQHGLLDRWARKAIGATWSGAPFGRGKPMATSHSFPTRQEARNLWPWDSPPTESRSTPD